MPRISTGAHDAKLEYIRTRAEVLLVCSAEPLNYAGVAAVALGAKAAPSIAAAAASATSGVAREIVVAAVPDGVKNSDGTASHYAIVNDTNSELLAAGPMQASVVLGPSDSGFTTTAFAIGSLEATTI